MELKECAAFVGIDWGDRCHAIHVIDGRTQKGKSQMLDQDPESIDQWVAKLRMLFPDQKIAVCLEQKRGPLINALLKFDNLILVPVNPSQLASFRDTFGPAGAKNDPNDAQLLAELLHKHSDRLRPWYPDGGWIRKLRVVVEDRRLFVNERTRLTNRLKSTLKQYFPLALEVTGDCIYSYMACQLLARYSTFEALQAVSDEELLQFYRDQGCYYESVNNKRLKAVRKSMPLTTDQAIIESYSLRVRSIVSTIETLNSAIDNYDSQINAIMESHHDEADIFESFPGAGKVMAPRLLGAFGSDRDRLSSANEIQQLAGVAPVTKQSGKSKVTHRRWACNKFLLQTFHEFAALSIKHSIWAEAYYEHATKNQGMKHQAAIRSLAFKWVRILFRCWKNKVSYDELKYCDALRKRNSDLLPIITGKITAKRKESADQDQQLT
tara:strand:- start:282 stop:1592 length:1311 start_codon:yes stop_codon:yes gene_type:complete